MRKILFLIPVFVISGCTGGQKPAVEEVSAETGATVMIPDTLELPSHAAALPEVPDTLSRPSQKIDYVMLHFWDNINFRDPKTTNDNLLIEQTFADFIEMLPHSSSVEAAKAAIRQLYTHASVSDKAYQMIADTADKYLFTEDSPMRNRSLYKYFIEEMSGSRHLTADQLKRLSEQINIINQQPIAE